MKRFAMLTAFFVILLAFGAPASARSTTETKLKCDLGRDYWLYAPAKLDKNRKYWLVVGVHGYMGNGKGAAGLASWAKRGDCIVIGPTFPSKGYQYLQLNTDKQLIDIFKALKKKYNLHDRMFVHGFSGGSQYVSRFAMKYPNFVTGASAHSGGTWGTVDAKAISVPFAVSCGQRDTNKMLPECPYTRLQWAKVFAKSLYENNFCFKAIWVKGVGHQFSKQAAKLTRQCFSYSTWGNSTAAGRVMDKKIRKIMRTSYKQKPEKFVSNLAKLLKKYCPEDSEKSAKTPAVSANKKRKTDKNGWYINEATLREIRRRYIFAMLGDKIDSIMTSLEDRKAKYSGKTKYKKKLAKIESAIETLGKIVESLKKTKPKSEDSTANPT